MTIAMWHSHPPWVATKQPQETTSCTVPDMTSPTCVKPCLTTYCICSFCGSIEGMYEYGMGVRKQHNTKRLRARPKNATSLQMSRLDRTAFAVPSDLHKKNGQTGMIVRCQVWPILKSLYHGLLPKKKHKDSSSNIARLIVLNPSHKMLMWFHELHWFLYKMRFTSLSCKMLGLDFRSLLAWPTWKPQ